jgi:hypothetical protein
MTSINPICELTPILDSLKMSSLRMALKLSMMAEEQGPSTPAEVKDRDKSNSIAKAEKRKRSASEVSSADGSVSAKSKPNSSFQKKKR